MKKLITALCITSLAACSNTNDFDASLDSKVSKPASPNQAPVTPQNVSAMPMPVNSQPVTSQPVTTVPATTTTIQTQPVVTAKGMNPPHGQPGHRCDLAVGAPLNSAPKTTATTPAGQNVVITPTPTSVKTAPGMNPPHGQPGHRCDISVGAPLNAAPSTTTTTPVTPVKAEEPKAAGTDQWKVDLKDKPASKDSSRN